jgi:uncharacterized secreted protein with C-terminal beta-propeller domain
MSYRGDRLEQKGSAVVEGSVKNQYSMDEYQGVLRVVTSTNKTVTQYHDNGTVSGMVQRNANLYCIDLENFSVVACVEAFAPEGEQAESVRFDGNMAYVCTAEVITLTDPVYFFDLSDLSNITYKDTGTIDGYSSSLVDFGEGLLLGIGVGAERNLKIEIYEQTQTGVESLCAYEQNALFAEAYKSYYIDRENSLVGLCIYPLSGQKPIYVLLHFDGYELNELLRVPVSVGDLASVRAVLIDGWLYVFDEDFKVVKAF